MRAALAGGVKVPALDGLGLTVNDFFNFDKGEGLDDASLEATISTSTLNSITDIFSGHDLQGTQLVVSSISTGKLRTHNAVKFYCKDCHPQWL